jgi:hypothetical protein
MIHSTNTEAMNMMQALDRIHRRMESTQKMFPNHFEFLSERYQQLIAEARMKQITPPWMAA